MSTRTDEVTGAKGFVAINNEGGSWKTTLSVGLPDGTYCDVVNGGYSGGKCSGKTVKVAGGKATVTVGAYAAIGVHVGAKL